ncbi:MAG: hypothetical protein PHN37_03010 [Candidatus Pacebacteria bacterium]|nr:hypothetical protein [Candidatus Paceibacterota bacterium]
MKKYFLLLILISLFSFSFIYAEENNISQGDFFNLLSRVTNFLFNVLIAVSVFFVLLAAYNFLFSEGDPEKLGAAKKNLFYCVIAIVIALFAKGSAVIIMQLMGV